MTITHDEVPVGTCWADVTWAFNATIERGRQDGGYCGNEWAEREYAEPEITDVRIESIRVYDDEGDDIEATDWHRKLAQSWFDENLMQRAEEMALEQ